MPSTVEHKVEMHQLAQDRKRAGLPAWDRKLRLKDVFRNEALTFEQRRDAIAARIRSNPWFADRDMFDDLVLLVEDLETAEDTGEFDEVWDAIYDIADCDRVWIETR